MVVFLHPDDRLNDPFPKLVVLLGMFISFATVLVLPYDVANSRGQGGGLRVDVMWYILYFAIAAMVFWVVPFAFFYYEADGLNIRTEQKEVDLNNLERQKTRSRCGTAVCYSCVFLAVFLALVFCLWAGLSTAEVPVERYKVAFGSLKTVVLGTASHHDMCRAPVSFAGSTERNACIMDTYIWKVTVTIPVFLICVLSFLGWILFMLFCGIGMGAFPITMVNEFKTRPAPLTKAEYYTKRIEIGRKAMRMLVEKETGGRALLSAEDGVSSMTSAQKKVHNRRKREFEQNYYRLMQEYDFLEASVLLRSSSALIPYVKLVAGLFGLVLSISWFFHVVLFMLPKKPVTFMLNSLFIDLEEAIPDFPLLGIIAYALFSFYLLICTIIGSFKFGLRLGFMRIFPMEIGRTHMNSFLANVWLLMLCSVPCVQFCTQAFPYYARQTSIDMLFGTQVRYLRFFRYIWTNNIFIYVIIIVEMLALIFFLIFPSDMTKATQKAIYSKAAERREDRGDDIV
eukprot:TRINITY_DN2476_c0_g1_i1.p1 TRINITY_DN2476_c0_g1~~TRINITY_DN2476_c0_g1_i1.p1  ORF type:complete len:511 (+),score=119.48 TRINITY_DN2476_c0_g1_i1:249-1781(+)